MLEKLGANRAVDLGLVDNTGVDMFQVPTRYKEVVEKSPGTDRQYLAHPDLLQTKTGRIILAYVKGHGKGPIIMRISDDGGKTFVEKTDTPKSWEESYETPTIYTLNFSDGREYLILISGCAGWAPEEPSGFYTSISKDNGETWTELKCFYPELEEGKKHFTTVVMSSLIQVKDADGNYIDKWMGVYHNGHDFKNYISYLSFDEEGMDKWSEPRPYLSEYREIENKYQICEVCLIRDPNPESKEILAIARTQAHNAPSTYFFSYDEGKTWTEPQETSLALTGERHKAVFDSVSGKLILSFREIVRNSKDWAAGDWIAWVGTYESARQGGNISAAKGDNKSTGQGDNKSRTQDGSESPQEYRLLLARDYTQNERGGDTGYSGVLCLPNNDIMLVGYGHFDEEFSKSWNDEIWRDLSYILKLQFKLDDLENYIAENPESKL